MSCSSSRSVNGCPPGAHLAVSSERSGSFTSSAAESIRTPATQATTNALANSVFNPAPFVYNGISYAGQSNVCLLTNPNGVTLPLSLCATDINKSYHKPTWTLALDHDLWEGTMVYATMRSGYRSGGINTQAQNIAAMYAASRKPWASAAGCR